MDIIIENSSWNNLGDGFYQFTLYEIYNKLFPEANVYFGEAPVMRSFHPNKRQLRNALRVNEYESGNLHVFSGPILMAINKPEYAKAIQNILSRGDKYALVSVSSSGLLGEDLKKVQNFLLKYRPEYISTRDPHTYTSFQNLDIPILNGICTAFLVDRYLKIPSLKLGQKYMISSFYRQLEPKFHTDNLRPNIEDIEVKSNNLKRLPYQLLRHLEIYLQSQTDIGDLMIVRNVQQVSNKSNNFNFKHPNSFITLNPLVMLSVIKGSEFTISERVHACATSLAFGKPARLMIENPRNGIFDRLGLDWRDNNGIMYPNSDFIYALDSGESQLLEFITNNTIIES